MGASVDQARPHAKNAVYRVLTISYNCSTITPSERISGRRERETDHLPRPPLVGRRSKYRGRGECRAHARLAFLPTSQNHLIELAHRE